MTDSQFLTSFATFFTWLMSIIGDTFDALMGNVVTRILIELNFLALIIGIVVNFVVKFTGKNRES